MSQIVELPVAQWAPAASADLRDTAVRALEQGHVLLFPQLDFATSADEQRAMGAKVSESDKNVSFDPASGVLRGSSASAADQQVLADMLRRYGDSTISLLDSLFPGYKAGRHQGRTSFRPVEIAGRVSSWRKDDTRLHVDSFPSSPTQGRRILRVFTNVNPNGQGRQWRLGEPFEAAAKRFLPGMPAPLPGSAALLHKLGITKSRRSAYDHYMLKLHDSMKADAGYQADVTQIAHAFAPRSSWMVYTDQASHAAMGGQFALEQTWTLDVAAMNDPTTSPLQVLQRLTRRTLV